MVKQSQRLGKAHCWVLLPIKNKQSKGWQKWRANMENSDNYDVAFAHLPFRPQHGQLALLTSTGHRGPYHLFMFTVITDWTSYR